VIGAHGEFVLRNTPDSGVLVATLLEAVLYRGTLQRDSLA